VCLGTCVMLLPTGENFVRIVQQQLYIIGRRVCVWEIVSGRSRLTRGDFEISTTIDRSVIFDFFPSIVITPDEQ
jgi:hypothetical protein